MQSQNFKLYYGEGWNFMEDRQPFYVVTNSEAKESDVELMLRSHLKNRSIGYLETQEYTLNNRYGIPNLDERILHKPIVSFRKRKQTMPNQAMPKVPSSFDVYVLLTYFGKINEDNLEVIKKYSPHPFVDFRL